MKTLTAIAAVALIVVAAALVLLTYRAYRPDNALEKQRLSLLRSQNCLLRIQDEIPSDAQIRRIDNTDYGALARKC